MLVYSYNILYKMSVSIYRLNLTTLNLINLQYDSNTIPLLTKENFESQYKLLGNFDIDLICDSIELYNKLKKYNIFLKIGDIISYISDTYYYDHPLVKFDIF